MENKRFYTVLEVAKMLGISRIAVFKKIKSGELRAKKIGRNFAFAKNEVEAILGKSLSRDQKKVIDRAVEKTMAEYGQTLKLLGDA